MAAGVVGLIAVTALQLVVGLAPPLDRAPVLIAIMLAAFAANWFWKSKLAPPVTLAAAGVAAVVLAPVTVSPWFWASAGAARR